MSPEGVTVTVFPLDEATRAGEAIASGTFSDIDAATAFILTNIQAWRREAREYLIRSGAEQADENAPPTIDITVGFWSGDPCECQDGEHECLWGIRWPSASNGDSSRSWVERCDMCSRFDSDDDAADALRKRLGDRVIAWGSAQPNGVKAFIPFVEARFGGDAFPERDKHADAENL